MKKEKQIKEPSIIKNTLLSIAFFLGGVALTFEVSPILFFLGIGLSGVTIIRTIRHASKYYKMMEKGLIEEEEKKESFTSKIKNKVKSFGKIKEKGKNKTDSKNKIDDKNTSKKRIDDIKNEKAHLQSLKNNIIDGVYGLKKDQIIQDRVNGREINKFYENINNKDKVYSKKVA